MTESAAPVARPRRRMRLLIAALVVTTAAAVLAWWGWQRAHRFDMVQTLAKFAREEGEWDNPWDLQERKIASLQQDLTAARDPIKRLLIKREIAQQYVNGGAAELGIAALEQLIGEYTKMLAPRDIETLKGDLALRVFPAGRAAELHVEPQLRGLHLPDQRRAHPQEAGAAPAEAAKRYEELLGRPNVDPENALVYRWLLNIATWRSASTRTRCRRRWLIPPEAFESDYDIGRFRDVAATRGVERVRTRRRRGPRGLRQRRPPRPDDLAHGHRATSSSTSATTATARSRERPSRPA